MISSQILRNILALFAAGIVGCGLILAVESLNMVLYPFPDNVDLHNPKQMAEYVESLPVAALCVVLAAYVIGSFSSAWTAAKLGKSHHLLLGMFMGVFYQIAGIWNFVVIPTPLWMWIAGFFVFIPPAYAGARLASRSFNSSPPPEMQVER